MYIDDSAERLMKALYSKDVSSIENWIRNQKNINAQLNCVSLATRMHLSAFQMAIIELGIYPQTSASTVILDLLIQGGAKISGVYEDGFSALFHAVTRNRHWVIDYLISKRVEVNIQNPQGKTIFHLIGNREMNNKVKSSWEKLLTLTPDFNIQDNDGNTPLHLVKNIRVAGIMRKNGARLDIQNHRGQYPDEVMAEAYGGKNTFTNRLRASRVAQEARALKKLCPQSSQKATSRHRL